MCKEMSITAARFQVARRTADPPLFGPLTISRRPLSTRTVLLTLGLTFAGVSGPAADALSPSLDAQDDEGRPDGCGLPATPVPAALEVDGRERELIVVLPQDYEPDRRHPLVIAFHGRTNPAGRVRSYYDLEDNARRPSLFVYPSGLEDSGHFSWSDPNDPPEGLRDFRLFDGIVRLMGERYCIDRDLIFAVGHSLGAWFTNSLACARGHVLRAIGTVAGGITAGTCRGEPAALLLHHPLDRLVPFEIGRDAAKTLSVARARPPTWEIVHHAGFDCMRFGDEDDPILFCPHAATRTRSDRVYPHQWPQGAGRAIMRFFEELP